MRIVSRLLSSLSQNSPVTGHGEKLDPGQLVNGVDYLGFQATGNGGGEPREQVDFGFVIHHKELSEVVRTGALVPLPPHYQLMTCISMAVLGIFDNWVRL